MTTSNTFTPEFSTELLKALALKQHLGEDYFILSDAKEARAYEGTEEDAKASFDEYAETKKGVIDFYIWCGNNLI